MNCKLKDWWERRKEENKRKLYNDGFDYAAGVLLRKEKTPIELQSFYAGGDMDAFDLGMDAAIDIIVLLYFVHDDRPLVSLVKGGFL